jgi:inosine/xanthosine triphosphate pyrophosphatase family protein
VENFLPPPPKVISEDFLFADALEGMPGCSSKRKKIAHFRQKNNRLQNAAYSANI